MRISSLLRPVSTLTAAVLMAGLVTGLAVTSAPQASAASTVGGTISRAEVLARAKYWYDRGDTWYSQDQADAVSDGDGHAYRPDCSGFVSMAWHLPKKSGGWDLNTNDFAVYSGVTRLGSINDLLPGDAMLMTGHMELFEKWVDPDDHTQGAWVYSENDYYYPDGTRQKTNHNINSWSEMTGYYGIRYNNIRGGSPDTTGDGLADLVGRTAAGDLLLYPNSGAVDGEATWGSYTKVSHGWGGMTAIASGDVTGDGLNDLIGQTAAGDLLLYTHSGAVNGEATWRVGVQVSHGWGSMTALLLGDVTGDGKADLVGRTATGDLLLYSNSGVVNGEATFRAGVKVSHGWSGMAAIVLGDVHGDGLADLIGQTAEGDLLLYQHSGAVNGELTWRAGVQVSHGWGGMTALLLGDVTGDGKADLVGRTATADLLLYSNSGVVNGEATFRAGVKVGHGWGGMTAILL